MDMRTAVDAYTTPESPLGQAAQEDLCRWYGLPSFNYAAMSDSKTIDEQFALEYGLTAMAGGLARGTLVHDVGYLESGLQSSCESIVFGHAAIGWAKAFMKEVPTDDEALALEEISEVGPGGNFLARKYTRRHAARLLVRRPVRPLGLRQVGRRRQTDDARPRQGARRRAARRSRLRARLRRPGPHRRDHAGRRQGARGVTESLGARRAGSPTARRAARLGRRRLPQGPRSDLHGARRDRRRGAPPARRSSCCGRRARVSATPAPACRASSSIGRWRRPRAPGCSRAGRPTAASTASSPTGRRGSAPAPTASTSPTLQDGRRRARLADVERYAALCERLPNIDFVMSMGLPEDADGRARRPRPARRHAGRHAQADRGLEPVRRHAAARHGRDGGDLRSRPAASPA